MPGVQKSPEESAKAPVGAICAPPEPTASNNVTSVIPQPRQPESLQGLLRFAMSATENGTSETKFLPLDEEVRLDRSPYLVD